jgi:hypothetical protein
MKMVLPAKPFERGEKYGVGFVKTNYGAKPYANKEIPDIVLEFVRFCSRSYVVVLHIFLFREIIYVAKVNRKKYTAKFFSGEFSPFLCEKFFVCSHYLSG